jgi:hypothetical protein
MERPLATRILLGLATLLFVAGCTMGALGLHPAIQNPTLSRLGMLIAIASLPPWMVATSWRAQKNIYGQLAHEHMAGYQMCLEQLAEDPDFVRQMLARIPRQVSRSPQPRKRGR